MVYKYYFVIFVAVLFQFINCIGSIGSCVQETNFRCVYPNNRKIDLSSFQNVTNGFMYVVNKDVAYFYQPVVDLPVNGSIEHAGIWKFERNGTGNDLVPLDVLQGKVNGTFTPIGTVTTAEFIDTQFELKKPKINYSYNKSSGVTCEVQLICEQANTMSPKDWKLELDSQVTAATSSGLSTGTSLLVIFFCLAGAYLGGGMLIMKYLRGAEGLEMIPNIDFWKELPGLVKDGFEYAVTCGRVRPQAYESI